MEHLAVIIGTRPEAIKMAPIIVLARQRGVRCTVIGTGQHQELFTDALNAFSIRPDFSLAIEKGGTLTETYATILTTLPALLDKIVPTFVLVHGDTASTFAAAFCSFLHGYKVGHVEAGLRSFSLRAPFPEEANRKLTASVATCHFCPTETAKSNLLNEGVAESSIHVVGNTIVDALLVTIEKIKTDVALGQHLEKMFSYLKPDKKVLLVTIHRRENFGANLDNVCAAVKHVLRRGDVQVVLPVHPNPNVKSRVFELLGDLPDCHLIDPVDYPSFVYLMTRAHLIMSDSGGVQEEAPTVKVPVLVLRDKSERPEGLKPDANILVGTDPAAIIAQASRLLDSPRKSPGADENPFGDGKASERILEIIVGS